MSTQNKVVVNSAVQKINFVNASASFHDVTNSQDKALTALSSFKSKYWDLAKNNNDKLFILSGLYSIECEKDIKAKEKDSSYKLIFVPAFVKAVRQWIERKNITIAVPSDKALKFNKKSQSVYIGAPDGRALSSADNAIKTPKPKGPQKTQELTDANAKIEVLQQAAQDAKLKADNQIQSVKDDLQAEIDTLKAASVPVPKEPKTARQAFDKIAKELSRKELEKLSTMISNYLTMQEKESA